MLRHMEDRRCSEGKKDFTGTGERAGLAGTAGSATLVGLTSSLIFASLREAQLRTSPGVPAGPS